MTNVDAAKSDVRKRVWDLLERENAAPPGVHGHIPTFEGAETAADRLAELDVWKDARVVKVVPDDAQLPVRNLALAQNKLVYMAVPKLAEPKPYYQLEPPDSNRRGACAPLVGIDEMEPVDLIVCGSVAVSPNGARLGKGAGYSDIEVALLQEGGLIRPHTALITTVHPLQILDEQLPETSHDFRVNLIVTPDQVIDCGWTRPDTTLNWDQLAPAKIAAIPTLQAMHTKRRAP